MIPLNKSYITEQLLSRKIATSFNLHLFNTLNSTNRYLKTLPLQNDHPHLITSQDLLIFKSPREQALQTPSAHVWGEGNNTLDICCAEMQTEGRGRFNRHWHSPFGENIYCSSRWTLNLNPSKLSGLSLITSLAVLATLKEFKISSDIKIKWPNDILWTGSTDKKLCGSLIEIISDSNGYIQVIIGIGLNVNTDTLRHPLPDKPWCSLYEITGQYFDRNNIIIRLLANLAEHLSKFLHHDLNAFIEEWNEFDYLAGKYINITQPSRTLSGIACGINLSGQLILQDQSGIRHFLSSGDTSLQVRPEHF